MALTEVMIAVGTTSFTSGRLAPRHTKMFYSLFSKLKIEGGGATGGVSATDGCLPIQQPCHCPASLR